MMRAKMMGVAAALSTFFATVQGCAADKPCQYIPAQPAEIPADLTKDLARPAGATACEPIDLQFRRRSDQSFLAIVRLQKSSGGNCTGLPGFSVSITSSRGTVSAVREHGEGNYTAEITPDESKTGEYVITASAQQGDVQLRRSRTAIVFDRVHDRWGQPQAVEGLVNTRGWEDSAYITPDGEYLFIMYLPISPSCVMEGKKNDPNCHRVQGQVDEKNRPGLASKFAADRLRKDGEIENQCLGVGPIYTRDLFKKYDVYAPPMMSYGFRRQPDGSFANPFPITVDGVSACVAPSGLEVHRVEGGKAVALMGLVDPASWNTAQQKDYPRLFTATIELDKPNVLALWDPNKKSLNGAASGLRLLFNTPLKQPQDNPHAFVNPDTKQIDLVFWDSEHHDEDIFYRLLSPGGKFPDGPWGPVMKTPVFSDPKEMEIQPFFDGKVLTVTKRYYIASRDFLGTSYADIAKTSSWGPERTELAVCNRLKGSEIEVLHAVGDATYADRNGKKVLYFVYLTRRANGLLDMNVGFVEEK